MDDELEELRQERLTQVRPIEIKAGGHYAEPGLFELVVRVSPNASTALQFNLPELIELHRQLGNRIAAELP